ncbi:MAG: hypothetical protein ISS83_02170 [Candidatus Pacebacteria bacterium]|nr:hypothetical protein [Candidatus Paceibacterota bacterium]
MALLPNRYTEKKDSPNIKKKITEQECGGVIQKIKDLVLKEQKRIQSAAEEDGPYWARMVKEDIIDETTKFVEGYELSTGWNSEDAHTLQKIRNLLSAHKQALLEIKNEITKRMTLEQTYYMLEQLLGTKGRERPTVGILDPKRGKIELHLEDI